MISTLGRKGDLSAQMVIFCKSLRDLLGSFTSIRSFLGVVAVGMLRVATGRVGSGNSKFSTGRVGSGQQIWKFHGSGRVTGQPTIVQRVGVFPNACGSRVVRVIVPI